VLESTRWLKELIHNYYRDVEAASDDPGRMVAACSALGPVEIVRALGMVPYFPENHAVLISATHQGSRFIARAQAEGYSQFVSAAMRSDIGALLDGHSPLVTAHGIKGPPRPDVVVYSTNTGHEMLRWFEFYGAHYGVPVVGVHPPPALGALKRIDVDATTLQLLHLIEQLERVTHRTLDMDRLGEVVEYTGAAAQLWADVLDLARAVPAPMTFFDQLVHLAPMLLLRGTREAVEYYRELKAEVESRVERGFAAVPGERHRLYWDGPPAWYAMRPLAELFGANGAAVVASTFCETFTLPGLDPLNPVESMARTYTGVFGNRSEKFKETFLAKEFAHFGVDAAVYHDCRTTPEASHVRYGLAVRTERATGVNAFVIEGDSHDERLFSLDRLRQQLTEFLEQHAEQFATP
jgi:benzoyl-CoA reductase/2-hydroxyglutaryl-CoA dehydratase subunit BcrC/BadD/HgdB